MFHNKHRPKRGKQCNRGLRVEKSVISGHLRNYKSETKVCQRSPDGSFQLLHRGEHKKPAIVYVKVKTFVSGLTPLNYSAPLGYRPVSVTAGTATEPRQNQGVEERVSEFEML